MWLKKDVVFTDPITLPAGLRVDVYQPAADERSDEYEAAKDCATRVTRDTGHKAVICKIRGLLRVLPREYLTDVKPEAM